MHGELVALLHDAARLVELCEVERRVDALRQQVQGERDQVDVPRPLPVAEEAALDALGAGHQAELRRRDGRPAVVVRVDGHDRAVPAGEAPAEPLHAVGVDVRREGLDGRRQVDDHLRVGSGIPLLRDGLADLERVVELRVVEALRRVLEHHVRRGARGELLAERRAPHGKLGDPVAVEAEDDAALRLRGRVVEVHDRAWRALDRLVRSLDQLRPRLREHRDGRVVGDHPVLHEEAAEVEVGLRRGGEADLDLLHAEADEQIEEASLPEPVHRVDECLVAVAEIGGAPDRRPVEHDVGPGAVGQVDGGVGTVVLERHRHGSLLDGGVPLPAVCGEHGGCMCAVASPSGEGGEGAARGPEAESTRDSGTRLMPPP